MTAPKNDKARKAWLAGLKDGDEVAFVSPGGLITIGSVFRSEKRNRFHIHGWSAVFTLATGKRSGLAGHWIIPVTAEFRRAHLVKETRERLRGALQSSGFHEFTDDQILAVSAILWPEQSK